ncbi:hypothetical protein M9Y10_028574 [Tritrichomonas musculus]|uniref:DDE-1 domain-containing protein n=1 Tax=Tritrichomonas musculus TaxID=1915356 RepID=A0ABR2KKV3_9EUKA
MDETMLSARKRLKVLGRKGILPLIPENIKLPHLTGCVTISASGHLFEPLIILPNKKTMRYLGKFTNHVYLASSSAGRMTKNLFSYYCLLLVCELSYYLQSLPDEIINDRILLLVDSSDSGPSGGGIKNDPLVIGFTDPKPQLHDSKNRHFFKISPRNFHKMA